MLNKLEVMKKASKSKLSRNKDPQEDLQQSVQQRQRGSRALRVGGLSGMSLWPFQADPRK